MEHLDIMDLSWAVRRLPGDVRDLLKKHGPKVFLAGGYLRATVSGEKISDLDLFSPSKDYAEACAIELAGSDKPYETPNAFTVKTRRAIVQFIHRWPFDEPTACMESFDFTIAKAAIWWSGERWESCCDARFYADLAAKRLVYCSPQRNEDAGGSMLRVLKFYQRGYRIPLDSLGAVIARLVSGLEVSRLTTDQAGTAMAVTGLLREVDPLIDPDHISHLPPASESAEGATDVTF